MAITQRARPNWYTNEDDTAWDKVKEAFQRDWQQTKHDMGANVPDLNQHVGDTVSQATGSKPIPPENVKTPHPSQVLGAEVFSEADESAYRYGYAAHSHFNSKWDDSMEANIRKEWGDDTEWPRTREAIRRGWEYRAQEGKVRPR